MHRFTLTDYALFSSIFLHAHNVLAEVQYTDIEPDFIVDGDGEVFALDIDLDGVDDFRFSHHKGFYYNDWYDLRLYDALFAGGMENSDGIAGSYFTVGSAAYSSFITYWAYKIPNGYPIGVLLSFQTDWSQLMAAAIATSSGFIFDYDGHWTDAGEAYLGLRIERDSKYYYGWIRVTVEDSAAAMTIHDYALETIPYKALIAGDTVGYTTVSSLSSEFVSINSDGSQIFIETGNNVSGGAAVFQLYDMTGKLLMERQLETGDQIITVHEIPGIYLVHYMAGGSLTSKMIALY